MIRSKPITKHHYVSQLLTCFSPAGVTFAGPGGHNVNDNDLSNTDVETDSEDDGINCGGDWRKGLGLRPLISIAGCAFWKTYGIWNLWRCIYIYLLNREGSSCHVWFPRGYGIISLVMKFTFSASRWDSRWVQNEQAIRKMGPKCRGRGPFTNKTLQSAAAKMVSGLVLLSKSIHSGDVGARLCGKTPLEQWKQNGCLGWYYPVMWGL